VSSLLGEEVVFTVASAAPDSEVPMAMARVQAGKREALAAALDALFAETGESSRPYSVSEDLMVVSDSPSHLAWAVEHLGQGASSAFASAVGDRYRRGAGWLIGIDAAPVIARASGSDAPPIELAGLVGMKYLFLEQRAPEGAEENEVTVMFQGARTGMSSWLADGGSGGAAEYLPSDALLAGYVSMQEPGQLFQEFTRLVAQKDESLQGNLTKLDETLGANFVANLAAAMGTEAAVVFPYFWILLYTWSSRNFNFCCTNCAIRKLAWCGINTLISAGEHPLAVNASMITSGNFTTAFLKTACPSILGNTWAFSTMA